MFYFSRFSRTSFFSQVTLLNKFRIFFGLMDIKSEKFPKISYDQKYIVIV